MGYVAARTARHKYIQYRELQQMDELYDLAVDPYEESNIIHREGERQVLAQMQSKLQRLLEQTNFAAAGDTVRPQVR
jgi:N-acetylglucosamine-6-sulfatase